MYASLNVKFSALSPNLEAIKEFIGLSIVVLYKSSKPKNPKRTPACNGSNTLSNIVLLFDCAIILDMSSNTVASGLTCNVVNAVITSGEKLGYACAIELARIASSLLIDCLARLYVACLRCSS